MSKREGEREILVTAVVEPETTVSVEGMTRDRHGRWTEGVGGKGKQKEAFEAQKPLPAPQFHRWNCGTKASDINESSIFEFVSCHTNKSVSCVHIQPSHTSTELPNLPGNCTYGFNLTE